MAKDIDNIGERVNYPQPVRLDSGLVPLTPYHARRPGGGRIFCSPQWVKPDGNTWVAIKDFVKQLPNNGWKVDIPGHGGVEIHPDVATKSIVDSALIKNNIGVHFGPELRIAGMPNILRWTLTKSKDAKQIENGDVDIVVLDDIRLGLFFDDWRMLDENLIFDSDMLTINLEQAKDKLSDAGLESINLDPTVYSVVPDWGTIRDLTPAGLATSALAWTAGRGNGSSSGSAVYSTEFRVQGSTDNIPGPTWNPAFRRALAKFNPAGSVPSILSAELTCAKASGAKNITDVHVSVVPVAGIIEPINDNGTARPNYGKIFTAYSAGGDPLGTLDANGKIAIPASSWSDPIYIGFADIADQSDAGPEENASYCNIVRPGDGATEPQIDYDIPPSIDLNTTSMDLSQPWDIDHSDESFEITNGVSNSVDLNWTAVSDQGWCTPTPSSGTTSAGLSSIVILSFDTDSLGLGTHTATITITDSNANNSPQIIIITLTVHKVPKKISLQKPEIEQVIVNSFPSTGDGTTLYRTSVIPDLFGGDDVKLSLDDHIITFLLDQSGSMTWNDNDGFRHTISRRLVRRLSSTYPGSLKFNLIKFGGLPVDVTLFAVKEEDEIDSSDFQSLAGTFFEDDESNFAGVRVVRRTDEYPASFLDGDIVTEGFLNKAFDDELIEDEKYYYKVFTFDKNNHFSDGVKISAIPRDREIPRGIASSYLDVLVGTGVLQDENTIGLWHFDESKFDKSYDFSINKNDLTSAESDPIWLTRSETPIGSSAVRFNGINSEFSTNNTSNLSLSDSGQISILAWIYPYETNLDNIIVARQNGLGTNYILSQNTSAGLTFSIGGSSVSSNNGVLSNDTWSHIAVTVDLSSNTVIFYVDGLSAGSGNFSSISFDNSSTFMYFDVGFDRRNSLNRFFGKITELSVHNTVRSIEYIADQSDITNQIPPDEEDIDDVVKNKSVDNGDRLVLIKYEIPSDFNYETLRIVRNDFHAPSWEEDGDLLISTNASEGLQYVTDTNNLVLGSTSSYRIFSRNSIGNYCYITDAALLTANIPSTNLNKFPELVPSLFAPTITHAARPGNRKAYLTWNNSVLDSRIARVEVYYSDNGFPVVEESGKVSGTLVFSGDIGDTSFVHRRGNKAILKHEDIPDIDDSLGIGIGGSSSNRNLDLKNNVGAFYTIINRDRIGRASVPVNVSCIPKSGLNEVGIPLLDVENIRYEIVNNNTLSVIWDNPVVFMSDIEGYLDDHILLYGIVTDEFGQPISEDTEVTMKITPFFEYVGDFDHEFSTSNISGLTDNDLFEFYVERKPGGILKAQLKIADSISLRSLISVANFSIIIYAFIPDTNSRRLDSGLYQSNLFEFYSLPVTITLNNPFEAELINKDNKIIEEECTVSVEGVTFGLLIAEELPTEIRSFDGSYVRSTQSFVARVTSKYKGTPTNNASVNIGIFDARGNLCATEFSLDGVAILNDSQTVTTPDSRLRTNTVDIQEEDEFGEPTGQITQESFVDIPILVPVSPQHAMLFVRVEAFGYFAIHRMFLVFKNILFIDLKAEAPIPDGSHVAEQFATTYLIDPDYPSDESKRTYLELEENPVSWYLTKKEFAENRPFYSTDDTVRALNTFNAFVISFVRSGVAKNVFFGPAAGVELHFVYNQETGGLDVIGERYNIRSRIVYDGLSASDDQDIEILPQRNRNPFGSRLLMEMPEFKNYLFADGSDYIRLVISRDPNNPSSLSKYAGCFMSCANQFSRDLIAMDPGNVVTIISSSEVEIIWGDVTEIIDPYTCGKSLLLGDESYTSQGRADVTLGENPETFVYFRINGFYPPKPEQPGSSTNLSLASFLNPCECLGIEFDKQIPDEKEVSAISRVPFNDGSIALRGGGSMSTGVPPTILIPSEPLSIAIVDNRVNGLQSDIFVVDGESTNEIIVEVSFANCPVPNGTPVEITVGPVSSAAESQGEANEIRVRSNTIYTETQIDPLIDSIDERSYATLVIEPLTPEGTIGQNITFTTRYDRSGDVINRISKDCACIIWYPDVHETRDEFELDADTSVFSGVLLAYDISGDSWSELSSMSSPRAYLNLEYVSNNAYAIGGMGSKVISNAVERYDVASDSWDTRAVMPTSRFGAMSTSVGGLIYVIGGITKVDENLEISLATEVYNPTNNSWDILADMPNVNDGTVNGKNYGICFGNALYMQVGGNNRIYILCGITGLDDDGNPNIYNDRVLYYDIDNDSWVAMQLLSGIGLEVYRRISPGSFVDGSSIVVSCGSLIGEEEFPKSEGWSAKALVFPADTFSVNVSDGSVDANDGDFSIIPRPRFRVMSVSNGNDHYFLGGANDVSQTMSIAERVGSGSDPFSYLTLASMPFGRSSSGASVGLISGNSTIFVAGGFQSGKGSGFVRINANFSPKQVKLDGKQSCGISIEVADESGNPPEDNIRLFVLGYLVFKGKKKDTDEETDESQRLAAEFVHEKPVIYPVLFSTSNLVTENGKAVVTLLPRSDDYLESTKSLEEQAGIDQGSLEQLVSASETSGYSSLSIVVGEIREPYHIVVEITVVDDFYYGQTIENLTGLLPKEQREEEEAKEAEEGTDDEDNMLEDAIKMNTCPGVSECDNPNTFETGMVWKEFSSGIEVGTTSVVLSQPHAQAGTSFFSYVPAVLNQLESPLVGYFNDIPWIPSITKILGTSDSTDVEILSSIDELSNEVPFGASALFDSFVVASELLSDNLLDTFGKTMYTFTDNEANMSRSSLTETIDEINSIDGSKQVPAVIGNLSLVWPITISAKANTTDTNDLIKLSDDTGGQSFTILSSDFEDDIVGLFSGGLTGSLGYGTYDFILDLGQVSRIRMISPIFDLPDGTTGSWRISASEDSYNYTQVDDTFEANSNVEFDNLVARYIRFSFVLITGFSASDDEASDIIPIASPPMLTQIDLVLDMELVSYIFLKVGTVNDDSLSIDDNRLTVQEIVISVDASDIEPENIEVGVAKSDSHNWLDFYNPSQPVRFQNGKIFIPIRFNTEQDEVHPESLEKIDKFTFKTKYGRWDPWSTVAITDSEQNIIDPSEYKIYPRDGIVVFDSPRNDTYTIRILNISRFKIGVKAYNRTNANPIDIYGFGYMYNTNKRLLSPVDKPIPEAKNVIVLPDEISPYDAVTASYEYYDRNDDLENISKRRIRWFINGVRNKLLDNTLTWNDVSNTDDILYSKVFTFDSSGMSVGEVITKARIEGESILKPGDELYYTIRVNDGTFYSEIVKSSIAIVTESKPVVSSLSIKGLNANNVISDKVTAADSAIVQFDFVADSDLNRSEIVWFVDNEEFKRGFMHIDSGIDRIIAGELSDLGDLALQMNNILVVQVTPNTEGATGSAVTSDSVSVQNAIPLVRDVVISPPSPFTSNDITLTYTFVDIDVALGDLNQSDQSGIKWFYSSSATNDEFVEATEAENSSVLSSLFTSRNQRWKAIVYPNDQLDDGQKVESNILRIR